MGVLDDRPDDDPAAKFLFHRAGRDSAEGADDAECPRIHETARVITLDLRYSDEASAIGHGAFGIAVADNQDGIVRKIGDNLVKRALVEMLVPCVHKVHIVAHPAPPWTTLIAVALLWQPLMIST